MTKTQAEAILTQLLLLNGSRAMSGTLDMGVNAISRVTAITVDAGDAVASIEIGPQSTPSVPRVVFIDFHSGTTVVDFDARIFTATGTGVAGGAALAFTAERIALNGIGIVTGTSTPEGAVTAPVGSLFLRTDGGAGTTLYVKESGAGNTGWVAK